MNFHKIFLCCGCNSQSNLLGSPVLVSPARPSGASSFRARRGISSRTSPKFDAHIELVRANWCRLQAGQWLASEPSRAVYVKIGHRLPLASRGEMPFAPKWTPASCAATAAGNFLRTGGHFALISARRLRFLCRAMRRASARRRRCAVGADATNRSHVSGCHDGRRWPLTRERPFVVLPDPLVAAAFRA